MNNLIPDVLKTVILYIKPYDLIDFFVYYNINHMLQFKYDLYYGLHINKINHLKIYFPNIIINKLCIIIGNNESFGSLRIPLNKITHLRIIGKNKPLLNSNKPNLSNCFDKYLNIVSIKISYVKLSHIFTILQCKKLRSIKITKCGWSYHAQIDVFTELPKLRIVKLLQCSITPRDADALLKCNRLKVISITNSWPIDKPFIFKHLTHLTISKKMNIPFSRVLNLSMFNQCLKLRYLNVFYCGTLVNVLNMTFPLQILKTYISSDEDLIEIDKIKSLRKIYYDNVILSTS